jgi:sterol 3beta-glucosyltransferase
MIFVYGANNQKGPYKAGYLSKKNHVTSPRTYRHYFELRNHILSWYESAESKYSPLDSIDLKVITRIEASHSKKFGIRLHSKRHHYTIVADSEVSQKEWMDELKKGSFMAHHSGNSVRIVLPFTRIDSIEKPSVFQFAENIKVRLLESDDPNDPAEEVCNKFFFFVIDFDTKH